MKGPSPAREVARDVLRRVEQGEAYASLALAAALDRGQMSPADKGLATELVYGVLRHRTRLDRALAAQTPRGLSQLPAPALVTLRIAAYQLLLLRVPAHAAVDDAVGAMKQLGGDKLAGFANAVLRKLATAGEPPPPPATDVVRVLEEVHSFPRWLGTRLVQAVGAAEAVAAGAAMNQPSAVALRVPPGTARDAVAAALLAERPDASVVPSPYLPEALLVRGAGAPESLRAFQEQRCTVQDVAAQLVGRLCGATAGERILDACAGVGGKSTHLAQLARAAGGGTGGAQIDAADLSQRKLDLGVDAARRLGVGGDVRPVLTDLTAPPPGALAEVYDRVLLDAPCSGLGVLRRHPEAKWRRRPADITALAALQAQLLEALAPRVRAGGVLVYSVCTFTAEEGPLQLARFLAAHPDFALAPPPAADGVDFAPFLDEAGQFHSWPHRHDTDAFFAARMQRRG